MKMIWLISCVLLTTAQAEPRIEYDRFGDSTTIFASTTWAEDSPHLAFAAVIKKHRLQELSMAIGSSSESWKYLKCRSLAWLLNGKAVSMGPGDYDGDVITGGVSETFSFSLSMATLRKLEVATSLEFKVCNDEVTLSAEDLAEIQDFALALDEQLKH